VSLSLREKQLFYDQLGQLLRAGLSIGPALSKLGLTARGSVSSFIRSLQRELDRGEPIGEAFRKARPALSEMEQATVAGHARSGQLVGGLAQLSGYFGALHSARAAVRRRMAYPLFVLCFGVLTLNAPLIFKDGLPAYVRATGMVLGLFCAAVLVVAVLVPLLRDAGTFMPLVDDLLRGVPFLGGIRRAFAISRFCSTYNMQLEAGVNVMESLREASRASRSGLIHAAVKRALPEVRRGAQAGEQLARSPSAFPKEVMGAIIVAEETGRLDQTLTRLAEEYQAEGFRRIDIAAEWIPRLIYISIVLYLGWQIIQWYRDYLSQYDALWKQLQEGQ
jgi:type II secretory pathway component PulF